MYVRVSAPRGCVPIGLGPLGQFRLSVCNAPNCHHHGRKSIVAGRPLLSEVQPEQFLDTIVRFSWLGVLPWPGKVPELRPQMLLSWSYLLRFLHEELNCCNIGLRGRAGCKTKTAPDTKFVQVADSSGGGGGIKASLGRDRMSSEPTTLLPLIFRPWPGGIGCLGKCREQPAKPLEVWRHLLARGHRRRPLAITLCQARFVLFYLLRLNLCHTNPIPGSLFLPMPGLTEILDNFKENRTFCGKIMLSNNNQAARFFSKKIWKYDFLFSLSMGGECVPSSVCPLSDN